MNVAGQVALWAALIVAAWNTGFFGSRWSRDRGALVPLHSGSVFIAAAPLALAWASLTGAALRGDFTLAAVASRVVVDAGSSYRAAAVLTSRPGALLTLAFLLSLITLTTATARPLGATNLGGRCVAVHSAVIMVLVALMVGAFPPFAHAGGLAPTAVPAELLHPGAALRGLCAVVAVAAAVHGAAWLLATRGEGDLRQERAARNAFAMGLVLSTLSLASDQWARTALAAGDGRNAGGVVLWLALALLSHDRVRSTLSSRAADRTRGSRRAAVLSHIGAACIVVAFAAHVAAKRATLALAPGQAVEAKDAFGRTWRLVNQGVSRFDDRARDVTAIAVDVQGPRGQRLLTSELAGYHVHGGAEITAPISRRGVAVGVLQTLLLTLESAGPDDAATVRVSFIPLAVLWFPGVVFLVIGTLAARPRPAAIGASTASAVTTPPEVVAAGEMLVRQWRAAPVDCPDCGRRPEPDSRFCSSCGRAMLPCARCGAVTAEPMARHCAQCGAALVRPAGRPNVSARSIPAGVGPDVAE